MNQVDTNAKIIWDYMLMHQEPAPADAILALGSNDTRVAERTADLYLQGYAPTVIFSGKWGRRPMLGGTEAKAFAEVAVRRGVPERKILIEDESTNTGENILFTRRLLEAKGLTVKSILLVQKPYMERRAYAAFRKQWPEVSCRVTSPQVSFEAYGDPAYHAEKDRFINTMVGDLLRVKEYPGKGFQIPQEIPPEVWAAYERLVSLGYDKRLPQP